MRVCVCVYVEQCLCPYDENKKKKTPRFSPKITPYVHVQKTHVLNASVNVRTGPDRPTSCVTETETGDTTGETFEERYMSYTLICIAKRACTSPWGSLERVAMHN